MPTKKEEKAEEFRKVTKQFLLDHLEEDELDLSMCDLTRVPVKELVGAFTLVIASFPGLLTPALVHILQATNAELRRPGNEATLANR